MSVYEATASNSYEQKELHLYGSSRIGMIADLDQNKIADISSGITGYVVRVTTVARGSKVYELSNHLGNVLVTVTDRKVPVINTAGTAIEYYTADVQTATDYAPFGMALVGRQVSTSKYRYAFNGKELDQDIDRDDYDFGARIYDARLGRWLSTDPLTAKYPEITPYCFVGNMPLVATDIGGYYIYYVNSDGKISKLTSDLKNLTQTNLKAGIQTLTSLTMGSTEWNKYQKDPNKHVILFLQTFKGDKSTTSAKTYKDLGTYKSEDKLTLFLSIFDEGLKDVDTDIDFKPTDVFNLVGINKNEISDEDELANTLFHEIKAHITGNIKNSKKEHEEHYNFGLLPVYNDRNEFTKYVTLDNSSAYNYALEAFNKKQPKDQDPMVSKIMLSQFRKSLNVVSAEEFKKFYDEIQVKKPVTPPPNNQ